MTGIFRAIPRRVHPRVRTVKALFRTYVDAIHYRKKGDERDDVIDTIRGDDDDEGKTDGPSFSSERLRQIEAYARPVDGVAVRRPERRRYPSAFETPPRVASRRHREGRSSRGRDDDDDAPSAPRGGGAPRPRPLGAAPPRRGRDDDPRRSTTAS